ncbi:MAG: hypothetical protein ACM3PE_10050 [Deltaproteobacteria bacterium]
MKSFTQIIIEVIKLIIIFLALQQSTPNTSLNTSVHNLLNNCLITIGALLLYFALTYISYFSKPLRIKVRMTNLITGEGMTKFNSHLDNSESEPERTIEIRLEIEKINSIFTKPGKRLLSNDAWILDFNTFPEDSFTLNPSINNLIEKTQYGFYIKLEPIIRQALSIQAGNIVRNLTFVVDHNRDADINNDSDIDILASWSCKNNTFWRLLFCRIDMDSRHTIKYYQKQKLWSDNQRVRGDGVVF